MRRRASVLAAGLAAVALAAGAFAQPAAPPETKRFPANDPATVKATALFTLHARLLTAEPDIEAQETRALGGREKQEQLLAQIQRLDDDALAQRYARSLEGLLSMSLMYEVMRSIYADPEVFRQRMAAARNVIHHPDGTTTTLPSLLAATYHRGDLRMAARTLQQRRPSGNVAGGYAVAVKGECPFPAGPVQLVQQGLVIEGAREGRLLLWGVLGATQTVFLATEQRYVAVTRSPQGVNIEAPDRPSELYAAPLGAPALVLTGTQRKTCTLTLTRQG